MPCPPAEVAFSQQLGWFSVAEFLHRKKLWKFSTLRVDYAHGKLVFQLLVRLFVRRVKKKVLDLPGILRRAQTISLYFALDVVMPRLENCPSTCTNQTRGLDGQKGGRRTATAATKVRGSSKGIPWDDRAVRESSSLISLIFRISSQESFLR